MERTFEITQSPEEKMLSFTIYILTEEVDFWSIGMKQMTKERGKKRCMKNFQNKVFRKVFS